MRAIDRDFWREVRRTRSRFLSILILVALAVAFLSGLRATAPDMKRTCDSYLDGQNFMDIQVLSTLGLTAEDLRVLSEQPGVSGCEGTYVIDAYARGASQDIVAKIYSLPEKMNLLTVDTGRMPRSAAECVADKQLLASLGLSLGDTVSLRTEGDFADALPGGTYTIVGTVTSPQYISVERGTSTLGSGSVKAFVYLPADAFHLDVYTSAFLTVGGARELTAFSDAYDDQVAAVTKALEPLSRERARLRRESLVDEANEKLADAQAKLDDAKADTARKLADARGKLSDARAELDDGWAKVQDARTTLLSETADAQAKIDDAKSDLADAEIELDQREGDYAAGVMEYEQGLRDYEDGKTQYEAGLSEYEKNEQKLKDAAADLAAGDYQLSQGYQELTGRQNQFNALMDTVRAAVNAQLPEEQRFADNALLLEAMKASAETSAAADAVLAGMYQASALTPAEILTALAADPADAAAQTALGMAWGALAENLTAAGITDVSQLPAAMAADVDGTGVSAAVGGALASIHAGLSQSDGTAVTSAYLLSAKEQLDSGWSSYYSGAAALSAGYDQYNDGKKQLAEAKVKLDDAAGQLEESQAKLESAKARLAEGREKLDGGWDDYYDGTAKVKDAEQELSDKTAEAQGKIDDAVSGLRDGEVTYNDGLADYREGKAEAEEKISDAEKKLADARRKVADIDTCEWYVLDRGSNPGYLGFGQDADRMSNLASVFPLLFFLVAALVCSRQLISSRILVVTTGCQ